MVIEFLLCVLLRLVSENMFFEQEFKMTRLQLFFNAAHGKGQATNAFKKVRKGHALVRVRAGTISHHHDRLHECLHDLCLAQVFLAKI